MKMTVGPDDEPGEVNDSEGEGVLVASPELRAAAQDPVDDRPAVGSWWWVSSRNDREMSSKAAEAKYDRPGRQWLACVVEVGSNYAKVEGVKLRQRIGLDDFHGMCAPEPNPKAFIDRKVEDEKREVRALMAKIQDVCRRLGVPTRQALAEVTQASQASQALAVVHGVSDAKKYKRALVRAKETTLPDLFKLVKAAHEEMARWMKAELIPAEAALESAKEVVEVIEGKIGTVELYAGLTEELVCIREGRPASMDERVRIMQRMHFMDEECLVKYEAGGMDFRDIAAFDTWLTREQNLARIFTSTRCIVAFRVRREGKDYGDLDAFIRFKFDEFNKRTLLYVRNGEQVHRLATAIDFGEHLFPERETSDLLGDDELWIRPDEWELSRGRGIITGRRRAAMIEDHRRRRRSAARKLWRWHQLGKPEEEWRYVLGPDDLDVGYRAEAGEEVRFTGRPVGSWRYGHIDGPEHEKYRPLVPEDIYYDDAMRQIQRAALEHNRVAVIVQGLLDRSTCLHPHPPWRIWTPEGFTSGIELSYDASRALTTGDAPDFEAYRRRLNLGMRPGCHTIGQRNAWSAHMKERHGDRWWRYDRYGKGPEPIHRVERVLRSGACEYRWTRKQVTPRWVPDPDKPGYRKATYPEHPCVWVCPADALTCVDAYTPGDLHIFYDDPRTRADYLQWAPILLACEDWHAAQRTKVDAEQTNVDENKKDKKRRRRT